VQVQVLPGVADQRKGRHEVPPIAIGEYHVAKCPQQGGSRFYRSALARNLVHLLLQPFDGIA